MKLVKKGKTLIPIVIHWMSFSFAGGPGKESRTALFLRLYLNVDLSHMIRIYHVVQR